MALLASVLFYILPMHGIMECFSFKLWHTLVTLNNPTDVEILHFPFNYTFGGLFVEITGFGPSTLVCWKYMLNQFSLHEFKLSHTKKSILKCKSKLIVYHNLESWHAVIILCNLCLLDNNEVCFATISSSLGKMLPLKYLYSVYFIFYRERR